MPRWKPLMKNYKASNYKSSSLTHQPSTGHREPLRGQNGSYTVQRLDLRPRTQDHPGVHPPRHCRVCMCTRVCVCTCMPEWRDVKILSSVTEREPCKETIDWKIILNNEKWAEYCSGDYTSRVGFKKTQIIKSINDDMVTPIALVKRNMWLLINWIRTKGF